MGDGFGNWSLDKFHHLLPLPILLRIAANNGPLLATSKDNVGWNLRTDLQFSIKTAYVVRCGATTVEGANWDVMFGSILWNIRHNQNVVVFEDAGKGATAILGDSKRITQSCCSAAAIIGPMGVGLSTSSRTHSDLTKTLEDVRFIHVRRNCNKVADRLCRYASSIDVEIHSLENPTIELEEFLLVNIG
ncbi:hypothetical protein V6N12_070464 [Hibiscus sabdariffa]|uniref:RNase H type-1 domain-containing protein n=1 Tax=Hibiscus sabdariffa TaxID=183260 RepID=A0ABR2FGV7_9ROSI